MNNRKCHAVQHSDQMVCDVCHHVWDMNDQCPPHCHIEHFLPEWATGVSTTPVVGSQLCTRDGRRLGNAVLLDIEVYLDSRSMLFICVTDVGTKVTLKERELKEAFHPPRYVMDPNRHPGVERMRKNKEPKCS
jgi:hypothetical protein